MAQGIVTIAEQRDGEIRKISYELVSEARRLADSLGQNVTAIVLGKDIKDKAASFGHYGADKVMVVDDQRLATYTTGAYVGLTNCYLENYINLCKCSVRESLLLH